MEKHIDNEARVSAWTLGVETLRGWLRESTSSWGVERAGRMEGNSGSRDNGEGRSAESM